MTYDYFYGQQAEMFTFYRVPKVLFTEECFWNVSTDAKLLYGILLDRMNLSARNNWLDEEGRVYIIFTIEEIKGALGCAEKKAVKLLDELEKKCGLIERKRQGLGKPNLIYVKDFISGSVERQFLNCQKDNSGVVKNTIQELSKAQGNNTDTKYIDFDSWASTFGETTTAIELAPEGTGYRARTRFAKFFNLPELMNMFKEVADIKTSDQLHLPVPEAKFETVVVQPSEYQKDMVASLSERAADVHAGIIDPSVDNMLKITSDGRKLGLDQRLMNPLLPDDPNSKLNACVGNVLRIWQDGQADKLTQLVFCDLSTPKNDGTFNVYDDIKTKLMANGVPAEEVAFIHDADTEAKKKELFAKVRTGQVRVLLGSTQKMGAGTNVQDKLVAVHHLDVGWRPSDMTQRNGRIIRQGNQNKEVQVYQYVTEGTFDAYLYQTLENKQKFISQIMTSKSPVRSCDDVDQTGDCNSERYRQQVFSHADRGNGHNENPQEGEYADPSFD